MVHMEQRMTSVLKTEDSLQQTKVINILLN